jgi:maleate cis-trans isomerase
MGMQPAEAVPPLKLGLIIPAVNTMSEPQFNKYAPEGMSIHVMRARIAGNPQLTLKDLEPLIEEATDLLMDAQPDGIVFHCTGTSMKEGVGGDQRVLTQIRNATQLPTFSTIGLVVEALQALRMKNVVTISPYRSNRDAVSYLNEVGIETVGDIALGYGGSGADYAKITPAEWVEIARENDTAASEGFFLSCTNTTQIEAIEAIEAATGKPVVNSNQAVLWGVTKAFKDRFPTGLNVPLGRLVRC